MAPQLDFREGRDSPKAPHPGVRSFVSWSTSCRVIPLHLLTALIQLILWSKGAVWKERGHCGPTHALGLKFETLLPPPLTGIPPSAHSGRKSQLGNVPLPCLAQVLDCYPQPDCKTVMVGQRQHSDTVGKTRVCFAGGRLSLSFQCPSQLHPKFQSRVRRRGPEKN